MRSRCIVRDDVGGAGAPAYQPAAAAAAWLASSSPRCLHGRVGWATECRPAIQLLLVGEAALSQQQVASSGGASTSPLEEERSLVRQAGSEGAAALLSGDRIKTATLRRHRWAPQKHQNKHK